VRYVERGAGIEAKIASFPAWHYEFEVDGHRTPIAGGAAHRNRQAERDRYIFDPLCDLFGGSLAGKRVLDLGCNAGFWSLRAVECGAEFVLGIDGRQMHIDQANFIFEAKGIDRSCYEFVLDDVYAADPDGPFDVVLCLGLLYHVSDPVTLIEKIAGLNDEVLVIDTSLSLMPGRFFELRGESAEHPLAGLREQHLVPTRQAVVALAESAGYGVVTLAPDFTSYVAAYDYEQGRRRTFLCARNPEFLDSVRDRAEPTTWSRVALTAVRAALQSGSRRLKTRLGGRVK
jgi:SAM-dependent methyltransferase